MNERLVISVIVPVYNGEKYIHRAVENVLCQMNGQVELILVDDGSTDRSSEICDEYASKFQDVSVVHKINGGLSSARNAGMKVARGKYISFLDVDDYIDKDMCDKLMDVIAAHSPDIIDFGWKYVSSCGEISSNLHKLPKNILLDNDVLRNTILPPLLNLCRDNDHFIYEFSVNKVYRRDIIEKHSVSFDEKRRIWEDRIFLAQYLKYCRNYYCMDRCFYNYVDIPGSLSRQYSMDFFRIILENYRQYLRMYADEYDFDTQYVNSYWCRAIENMIFRSLEQTENMEAIKRNILDILRDEQVIQWYTKRMSENAFEQRVRDLIIAGKIEEAMHSYKKRLAQKRRHQRVANVKNLVKRGMRRIIAR